MTQRARGTRTAAIAWRAWAALLAALAAGCVLAYRISGAFGRGVGLTVALALIPSTAYLVVGLGSAEARGPVDHSTEA